MTDQLEVLSRTMRGHDHEAPDPDAVVRRLAARLPRARRRRPVLLLGVAAAGVAAAVAVGTTLTSGPDADPTDIARDPSVTVSPTPPSPAPPSTTPSSPTPAPTPGTRLDPLTYTLTLSAPENGIVRTRVTVTNDTGAALDLTTCDLLSGYSWGVLEVDRPDAPLSRSVLARCGGGEPITAGRVVVREGPDLYVSRLAPGEYVAAIDVTGRSTRLTAPLTVE